MARISEINYENMIAALNAFASKVYVAASEMQTAASVAAQAIGAEDKAAPEIYAKIRDCQLKYAAATEQAKAIAQAMQEELDRQREEDQVWSEDD